MDQKLIVGLGNPGKKYAKTRHNVGFMVVDALAEKYGVKFQAKKKLGAEIAEINHNSSPPPLKVREGWGELLIFAKPQTFMNDSGRAISKLLTTYNLSPYEGSPVGRQLTDLLVVHDEIDLPLGTLKIYGPGRSSAGHKGVESIIDKLGNGFTRLRIGIENRKQFRIPPTDDYVLQNFTKEEQAKLNKEIIPKAIEEIKKFLITNV